MPRSKSIEQAEFEPMADEIVIECKTEAETDATLERHRAGELYLRIMEYGKPGKLLWRFVAVQGERAQQWHGAKKRRENVVAEPVAELQELPF